MPPGTGRFRRTDRILRSKDFKLVLRSGERTSSRNFVVFVAVDTLNSQLATARRIGITVSKRVGNSVVRNHVKRRIREWYRSARQGLPVGSEIVVIARKPCQFLPTRILFEDLDRMISRYRVESEKMPN
jgi:ribonuclease P protein component